MPTARTHPRDPYRRGRPPHPDLCAGWDAGDQAEYAIVAENDLREAGATLATTLGTSDATSLSDSLAVACASSPPSRTRPSCTPSLPTAPARTPSTRPARPHRRPPPSRNPRGLSFSTGVPDPGRASRAPGAAPRCACLDHDLAPKQDGGGSEGDRAGQAGVRALRAAPWRGVRRNWAESTAWPARSRAAEGRSSFLCAGAPAGERLPAPREHRAGRGDRARPRPGRAASADGAGNARCHPPRDRAPLARARSDGRGHGHARRRTGHGGAGPWIDGRGRLLRETRGQRRRERDALRRRTPAERIRRARRGDFVPREGRQCRSPR